MVNLAGSPVHQVVNPAAARRAVPAVPAAVLAAKTGLAKLVVFQVVENLKGCPRRRVKVVVVAALRTDRLALELKRKPAVANKRVPTAMEIVRANPAVIAAIPVLCPAG